MDFRIGISLLTELTHPEFDRSEKTKLRLFTVIMLTAIAVEAFSAMIDQWIGGIVAFLVACVTFFGSSVRI